MTTETPQAMLARLTGFTEGPWEWDSSFLGLYGRYDYEVIPFIAHEGMWMPDGKNAALIAAAPDLHRELAASLAREAKLREVLAWYGDQMCEGFCDDFPAGFTNADGELDCSGCKARAALGETK